MNSLVRLVDVLIAGVGLLVLAPILCVLTILCFFDTKSSFFIQTRLGKRKKQFQLIKFRTMKLGTPSLASHLVGASAVTAWGRFLRRTKLDELPQLLNVLKGEMSLVGPRPCLPNQYELISERERLGVFEVQPGITGLAQIQGIDMSTPQRLAVVEKIMIDDFSIQKYFWYIFKTVTGKGRGDGVVH